MKIKPTTQDIDDLATEFNGGVSSIKIAIEEKNWDITESEIEKQFREIYNMVDCGECGTWVDTGEIVEDEDGNPMGCGFCYSE